MSLSRTCWARPRHARREPPERPVIAAPSALLSTAPRSAGPGYVSLLRDLAFRGLKRMYIPQERRFYFCLRRRGDAVLPEGRSHRYAAMVVLGLVQESPEQVAEALHGASVRDLCDRLIEDCATATNLGDVAVTLWAACAAGHPDAERAHARLVELDPARGSRYTVELAWAVTGLTAFAARQPKAAALRDAAAARLLASCSPSAIFPHMVGDAGSTLRAHVSCFADLVYPTQALAHYAKATGHAGALQAARACAEHFCAVQGPEGQWWWHYDARTGDVVEGFPVYAVHQDAMAPMALFDLADAGGGRYDAAIQKGLAWLASSPELGGASLVDPAADLIWRKVARREPGKLARAIQAAASRVHPSLRAPGLDLVLRPGAIDYEDRPYHLGWILYAFPPHRAQWRPA